MIPHLLESFDQPVAWQWTGKTPYRMEAAFTVDDPAGPIAYDVSFERTEMSPTMSNTWHVEFGYKDDSEWTPEGPTDDPHRLGGTGHQMQVLATVVAIAKEFLRTIRPQRLTFFGKQDSPGRQKVYQRLLQRAVQQFPDYASRTFSPTLNQFDAPDAETRGIKGFQLTRIRG